MNKRVLILLIRVLSLAVLLTGCQKSQHAAKEKKTIVVTYAVLESVVRDLVGDTFEVKGRYPTA